MRLSSNICSRWGLLKLAGLSRASSRARRSTSSWSEDPGRFRAKQFWFLRGRNYICSSKSTQTNIAASSLFVRSEEHTSELQSLTNLVCRLLLEKKKKKI